MTPAAVAPRHLAKPLFDSALIVLGVVLGFLVNQWAQERAQRERTTQALAAIREELVVDRRALTGARDHHLGVRDTLAVYRERELRVPERVYMGGMFSPARPVFGDAAPNFALLTGDWAQCEARPTEECDSAIALSDRVQHRPTATPRRS